MANLLNAAISVNGAGDNTIIAAPGATTCIKIHRLTLSNAVATAQSVIAKDGASNNLTGAMALPTSVGGLFYISQCEDAPVWVLSQNNAFILNLANATLVTGFVSYSLG